MRKIIYPLLILLITCLGSCSYHLDLDTVAAKEKLVLYCFPSNSDTTVIQLSKSIPVGHDGKGDTSLRNAEVHFSVNGKEQEVYWNEDSTSSLPARCYYTLGKCAKEDIVRIRTSMEGLPSIWRRLRCPENFRWKLSTWYLQRKVKVFCKCKSHSGITLTLMIITE